MKFTTNTKPLAEALNLGIIDSNVSNYYRKSCVTQLSANEDTLTINIESSMICTEISIKGMGVGEPATAFVDSVLFKKLIHTLDSNVTIELDPNGVKITSGKSKFTLGNDFGDITDMSDLALRTPIDTPDNAEFADINKEDWKYIKDNQMYAVSKSFARPVYTKVWIGENGDVLTGDFELSLFTHSQKCNLGTTCLLSDTIINLMNSLPESAKITKVGTDYIVKFSKDSYDYVTQFTPQYEDDGEVGQFKADMLINRMSHPEAGMKIFTGLVTKLLNQAILLSSSNNNYINMYVKDGELHLSDDNVNGAIPIDEEDNIKEFSAKFKLDLLKQVISNYGDRFINIYPIFNQDTAVGITVWNEELTTIFAAAV